MNRRNFLKTLAWVAIGAALRVINISAKPGNAPQPQQTATLPGSEWGFPLTFPVKPLEHQVYLPEVQR